VNVTFQLRKERNLDRIRALLDLSFGSFALMYISLLLLLITGIVAGFMGDFWGRGWIWTAIILLIVVFVAMGGLGSAYFTKVREAVGVQKYSLSTKQPLGNVASLAELETLLTSSRPLVVTAIGVIGLIVILWLMIFKPF
jgi:hypothetical protein